MDYSETAIGALEKITVAYQTEILESIDRYSHGEGFALNYLLSKEEAAQPSEISSASGSSAAAIAALLGRLEKKGLVTRSVDSEDRRKIRVFLTEKGRREANRHHAELCAGLRAIFTEMGERDTDELVRLVERFLQIAMRLESEKKGKEIDQAKR